MRDLSTEVAVAVVLHDLSAALDTPTTPSSWRKALSTPQACGENLRRGGDRGGLRRACEAFWERVLFD